MKKDLPNLTIKTSTYTMEELNAKHNKDLKALDGEKRAAIKKVKGTAGKGKKLKDLLTR
jgi:hypothetical protein